MTYNTLSRLGSIILLISPLMLGACSSQPVSRGIVNSNLAICSKKPNCVSSSSLDRKHQFPPLKYLGTRDEAKKRLLTVLDEHPNAKIVEQDDNYLRVEFTTSIMRFVDDGEFLIGEDTVQVRSASRVGYSDLGKNRSRMEKIKDAFEPCCNY